MNQINWCVSKEAEKKFDGSLSRLIGIAEKRILRRSSIAFSEGTDAFSVMFGYSEDVENQGFRIDDSGNGITITAGSVIGLIAGIGRFLRDLKYRADHVETGLWRGESIPDCPVRGIQMDSHFCNFYHMAPENEIREYVEDLALWGINCMEFVFPLIDFLDWDDPEIGHVFRQIKAIYDSAKSLGIRVGMEIVPNQDFVIRREEFAGELIVEAIPRRGNNGHNICPNKPGALEYLTSTYAKVICYLKERGVSVDFICFWPYDEGGCSCEKCRPWGANGFLKASESIWKLAKKELPDVKVILSTWMFDTPGDEGEWSGLAAKLTKKNGWIDFILADSHADFPKYPLTHPIPGGLSLLNYPEISMWALFPWGGYGANPLPNRFERLWNQVKDKASGGIAYSEGIFDDINKVVVSQLYWNRNSKAEDIVRDYIRYEFSDQVVEEVLAVINTIERNHIDTAVGANRNSSNDSNVQAVNRKITEAAKEAVHLMEIAETALSEEAKKSWRWRILFIRAKLDALRFRRSMEQSGSIKIGTSWTEVLIGSAEAKDLMMELVRIYHSNLEADDALHPMFRCVRPAVKEI